MALKIVRRYDANGRELTEKDLETFRLDSPVVREILANLKGTPLNCHCKIQRIEGNEIIQIRWKKSNDQGCHCIYKKTDIRKMQPCKLW